MVDPQSVDNAQFDEFLDLAVGDGKYLRIFDANTYKIINVEKPSLESICRVDVEELLPYMLIGPIRIRRIGRHVIRYHVEDDAKVTTREFDEALFAPEFVRDTCRIDNVIT